jgi:RNA polymerase sigma-70 factor (ECF subfamily)
MDQPAQTGQQKESLEALFLALESPLLNYGRRFTGDIEAAEDLVQEAFMRLHRQFSEVEQPRPWLYRTVHNLALNQQRQKKAGPMLQLHPAHDEEDMEPAQDFHDPLPLPDEQIARLEGVGLVRLNLKNLDSRSQELIHLKFEDGMSYKEMAEKTGLTSGHVGYLLHHALKQLGDELAKSGLLP